jgi:Ca2+/Na+ antiporter
VAPVVCDDYFCESLEVICDQLDLSEAVAGATFMAAGSSAPELATSLVATFTTRDSTGLGTILGSAVFNLVAIICLSGMFGAGPTYKLTRGQETDSNIARLPFTAKLAQINAERAPKAPLTEGLYLDWRPLGRDAIFYVVALAMCVIFALTSVGDGWEDPRFNDKPGFVWWEGAVLSLCYGIYIQSMVKNKELMKWAQEKIGLQPHIQMYIDELEALDEDEDEEGEERDEEEPADATQNGRAIHMPSKGPGAENPETAALLEAPAGAAPGAGAATPPARVAASDDTPSEGIPMDVDTVLSSAGQYSFWHLNKKIKFLEDKIEAMEAAQTEKKVCKWDYKPKEEEEADTLMDTILEVMGLPWEVAFKVTIPKCDRNSFQEWDDKAVNFGELDALTQELLRERAKKLNLEPPEDTDAYYRGKYKRTLVDTWYNQSKRYAFSFTMSIVWIGITSWAMVRPHMLPGVPGH